MLNVCEICEAKDTKYTWRCEEHYRCDDCGTRDEFCYYGEGLLCTPCHRKRVAKRIAEFTGDTQGTDEIVCPHCGYEHGDSFEFKEGEHPCADCERVYHVERVVDVTYNTFTQEK